MQRMSTSDWKHFNPGFREILSDKSLCSWVTGLSLKIFCLELLESHGHQLPPGVLRLCLLWENICKLPVLLGGRTSLLRRRFNEWMIPHSFSTFCFCLDWNELFTTKCISCGFPIEAGDRWVEALNNNYHSQCFNCSVSISVTLSATLLPFSSLSSARKIWRVKASLQKVVKSFAKITPRSIEVELFCVADF